MPVLKNARHEKFAQAVAKGTSVTEAYTKAEYKGDRKAASNLWTNVDIKKRVEEIQSKTAKKVEVTVDSLTAELEEARALALKEKQSSAAVSATMGKAKLFGLGSENRKISGTIQVVTITAKQLDALTDDELATLETAYPVLQKLGLISADAPGGETEAGSAEEP
ncbi:terminase small subunit [Phyllobacterium sp. P5_D12]